MSITDNTATTEGPLAVFGATGRQGSAVVAALLAEGAPVRALVRDPNSPGARQLAAAGAELATADLDRPDTLVDAVRGAAAVFAMTTFTGPGGIEEEVEHGRAIGDAVRAAGVPRMIYSSVGGAERQTGIPHFESKRRVEEHLESLGLQTTFLRPTFFMDNFASFSRPREEDGTLVIRLPIPDGVPLQMVSARDIGRVAATALLHPDRVPEDGLEIAGDELTGGEIAAAFSKAKETPARYEALPVDVLPDEDQKAMFTWFAKLPAYRADVQRTRELVPDLQDLQTWAEDEQW